MKIVFKKSSVPLFNNSYHRLFSLNNWFTIRNMRKKRKKWWETLNYKSTHNRWRFRYKGISSHIRPGFTLFTVCLRTPSVGLRNTNELYNKIKTSQCKREYINNETCQRRKEDADKKETKKERKYMQTKFSQQRTWMHCVHMASSLDFYLTCLFLVTSFHGHADIARVWLYYYF